MLPLVILLSIMILFLFFRLLRCSRQVQKLTEEIDHFLMYPKVSPESLEEGILSNLTNQVRRLESQLLYEKQHSIKREQEMTQFIENMAHQIKTALTVLQIRLDLAQETAPAQSLFQSQASLERLTREIERILNSSQLACGKITMDFESLDYPVLIGDCIASLTSLAQKKNILFCCQMPEHFLVYADRFWLSQALENLLKNAVEHSPAHTSVQICLEESRHHICCTVTDSGKGIPDKEFPQIFLRFHRGNISKSGYGIGLSMAKDIAKAHHGTITARNLPEQGCSFTISLPLFADGKLYQS